jgi:hypothetical protein
MRQPNNNYARCKLTGSYVFFNDATAPTFTHPEAWAFWRAPAGQNAEMFGGQLVGVNPVDAADAPRTQH